MADGERRPLLRGPSATAAPPPLPSAPTFSLLSFSRSISRGISRYGALYSRIDAELEMRAGEVEIGELRADEGGDGATLKKPGAHPHVAAHSKLGALAVGVMCFASIAGGPVGIEPAVGAVGALPTILALVAAAFVWSATQALVATELATMFPSNAGYVAWVIAGLGPTMGFVNAWASILMNSCNLPLYTNLIASSVNKLLPRDLSGGEFYAVQLGALLLGMCVNVVGVEAVERVSGVFIVLAQTPFVLMPIVWASRAGKTFDWRALGSSADDWAASTSVALSCILWATQGFNQIGNLAGEVRDPQRDIPRGVSLAIVAITLNYVWPLLVTIPMSPDTSQWDDGFFTEIARSTAPWLGVWAAICACLSCMSNLTSQLALGARALQCVARGGMMPRACAPLGRNASRFDTPVPAILASGAIACALMALDFSTLVVLELLLANVGLVLQFAAFLRLKHVAPSTHRPFAVPGGLPGAYAVTLPFFALVALLLVVNVADADSIIITAAVGGLCALLTVAGALWARRVVAADVLDTLAKAVD